MDWSRATIVAVVVSIDGLVATACRVVAANSQWSLLKMAMACDPTDRPIPFVDQARLGVVPVVFVYDADRRPFSLLHWHLPSSQVRLVPRGLQWAIWRTWSRVPRVFPLQIAGFVKMCAACAYLGVALSTLAVFA